MTYEEAFESAVFWHEQTGKPQYIIKHVEHQGVFSVTSRAHVPNPTKAIRIGEVRRGPNR